MSASDTARVLARALPYIRRFSGRTVVVKYGGNALAGSNEEDSLALFAEDIVLMHTVGVRPVVVHGGGPQIDSMLHDLGMTAPFVDGLRVTDDATMEVVGMVLNGRVNPGIVAAINAFGEVAVGLSGEDGRTLTARPVDAALGRVGDIDHVSPGLLRSLLEQGFVPVMSTVASGPDGRAFNVNADTAAAAIAAALGAEKIVYLTDIAGVRRRMEDAESLVATATSAELEGLLAEGVVTGGMIPKVRACLAALRGGVASAHILDGRVPHALLLELFTDEGVGTMVVAS
ncbi:MAG: acetylglutamate kinase [Actinomycetota bacterium]